MKVVVHPEVKIHFRTENIRGRRRKDRYGMYIYKGGFGGRRGVVQAPAARKIAQISGYAFSYRGRGGRRSATARRDF